MRRTYAKVTRFVILTILGLAGGIVTFLLVQVVRLPDQFRGFEPGDELPRVRLLSPEGGPIDTQSWRGRPTLLLLLDPACDACLNELDNIEALAPMMPDVRIVRLLIRAPDAGKHGFAAYIDPTGELIRSARRLAVPVLYWIGPDGRVAYARSGARSFAEDAAIFNALLAGMGANRVDATEDAATRIPAPRR